MSVRQLSVADGPKSRGRLVVKRFYKQFSVVQKPKGDAVLLCGVIYYFMYRKERC